MSVTSVTKLWEAFARALDSDPIMSEAEKLNFLASKVMPEIRALRNPWTARQDRIERSDTALDQEVSDVLDRIGQTPAQLNAAAAAELLNETVGET